MSTAVIQRLSKEGRSFIAQTNFDPPSGEEQAFDSGPEMRAGFLLLEKKQTRLGFHTMNPWMETSMVAGLAIAGVGGG